MKKDLFGIDMRFYAVLAFVLAALNQTLLCALILAAMIFIIKEEWATRQVMQAFFVCLFSATIGVLFSGFTALSFLPLVGGAIAAFFTLISGIVGLVPFVFAIVGIVKATQGKEANLPLLAKWARKAHGITEQKVYNYTSNDPSTPAQ